MERKRRILVAGAGGFIGGHLAARLAARSDTMVRAVDCKPIVDWQQVDDRNENVEGDLREFVHANAACHQIDEVFNLACDMGGMGYLDQHKAQCMASVLVNTQLLRAAVETSVQRFFFASSACVYDPTKWNSGVSAGDEPASEPAIVRLRESDAYPANPQDGYGWEKLFSERMCRHFDEDFGLQCCVARFNNVYGPYAPWEGGRDQVCAALCRKVIQAQISGKHEIEIWGDGHQTRTFMYVADCVEGMIRLMDADVKGPINLASSVPVTINQLLDVIERVAGIKLQRHYNLDAPQGAIGRCSDNTMIREAIGWEPHTSLEDGIEAMYHWLYEAYLRKYGDSAEADSPPPPVASAPGS